MWHKLQTYALGIGALLLGAAVVMIFASVATALLILRDPSAPVGAMPPAAGPSYQAAEPSYPIAVRRFPPDSAQAERTPAERTPREPAAPYGNPDHPTSDRISGSDMPRAGASTDPQSGVPQDSESSPPIAMGQSIFTSRGDPGVSGAVAPAPAPGRAVEQTRPPTRSAPTKALETVDPREILRQAKLPK